MSPQPQIDMNTYQPITPAGDVKIDMSTYQPHDAQADDTRNGFQRGVDALTEVEPANKRPGMMGKIETAFSNIGAGGMSPLSLLAHPIAAGKSILKTAVNPYDPDGAFGQMVLGAVRNPVGTLETLPGMAADGEITGAVGDAARPLMARAGEAAQNLGSKNMTRILDQGTTAAVRDARTGVNPGRAMLNSGVGPTLTRNSLANKIAGGMDANGQLIGNAMDRADWNANAPRISPLETQDAVERPITAQKSILEGPGGTASTAPYDELQRSMMGRAPNAQFPVYGPDAPSDIAPSDVWHTLRNLDKNTKFHTDPEIESVNETRRDIRGNLRPLIEKVDPSIKPLSSNYAGLRSAQDALERASARSGSGIQPGILHNLSTNTLFNTASSKLLNNIGGELQRLGGASSEGSIFPGYRSMRNIPRMARNLLPENTIGEPGGEDFTHGGFPVRSAVITREPQVFPRLSAQASEGETQPMIQMKAPTAYPSLAEDYSRDRIIPNKFNGPPENPFNTPRALLPERASRAKYGR